MNATASPMPERPSDFLAARAHRATMPIAAVPDPVDELEAETYVPDVAPAEIDGEPIPGNPLEIPGLSATPEQAFRVKITPEAAAEMLSRLPARQRTLKPERVATYARLMRAGQWRFSHEAIMFDTNGRLIEGQHRLRAVVASGVTVELMVTVGAPPDSFAVIDQGLNRSAEQFLGEAGETIKYVSHVRTACGFLWQVSHGLPYGANKALMSWSQQALDVQLAWLQAWPEVSTLAPETAVVARPNAAGIPPRLLLTTMAQATRTEHWPMIDEFLEGLRTGADMSETDPRYVLRSKFAPTARDRAKLTRSTKTIDAAYSMVVIGWNAFVAGEEVDPKELTPQRMQRAERAKVVGYEAVPAVTMYDAA